MKRLRLPCLALLLLGPLFLLPLRAAPDARLAGYWASVSEEAEQASFTFGILGKWTIVTQHWAVGPADVKVRYTAVSSGDGGTLNADEPLDKLPAAPRTIRYELQNGELLLAFPGTTHVGRYRLVKKSAPAVAGAGETVDFSKTLPGTPAESPAQPAAPDSRPVYNRLIGSWATEPGVERQLTLFIARLRTAETKINQRWAKGSDNPLVSKNGDYAFAYAGGRGTLTQVKPDYEGSAIPPVLNFTFEGEVLVVTVDHGAYAGQYRLIRQEARPKQPPAPVRN
jgi:hypothetical protein